MEIVQQRTDAIEGLLVKGDWTLRRQAQIAEHFEVSTSQVRKDAAKIRREWAGQEQEQSPDELRADWRQRVLATIHQAVELGHTRTGSGLWATVARVLGSEGPTQIDSGAQVHTVADAPRLAADVRQGRPAACELLGVDAPALPDFELEDEHGD